MLCPAWVHLFPKSVRCARPVSSRFESPFFVFGLRPPGSLAGSGLAPPGSVKNVRCVRPVSASVQSPFAVSGLCPSVSKVRSLCPACVHQFPKSVRCVRPGSPSCLRPASIGFQSSFAVSGLVPSVSQVRSLCSIWVHQFPKSVRCVLPGSTRFQRPVAVSSLGPPGSKVLSLCTTPSGSYNSVGPGSYSLAPHLPAAAAF